MKKLLLALSVITLLLIVPLLTNAQDDVTELMNQYERCNNPDSCKKIELTLIKQFLSSRRISLNELESMLANDDMMYEVIQGNLTGNETRDYIFKIEVLVYRLGEVIVVKRDEQNKKFVALPIIEKGLLYNMYTKDVSGDGVDELIFSGYGTGTGYWEEWLAIYKYKDNKMNLIWSGDEKEVTAIGGKETTVNSRAYFYNVPGYKSKEINQTEITKTIDTKTKKQLPEKMVEKRFRWSLRDFKFIEVKGK